MPFYSYPPQLRRSATLTRKNLVFILISAASLTLILNLHLLNFDVVNPEDGSAIDIKIPKTRPTQIIPPKSTLQTWKEKLNPWVAEDIPKEPSLAWTEEYNITDFQITKRNELETPFIYTELLQSYTLPYIISRTQSEKCEMYFTELVSKATPNWQLANPNIIPYDRGAYERLPEDTIPTTEEEMKDHDQVIRNKRAERQQMDAIRHYLAYDHCFLNNPDLQERASFARKFNVTDLERRIFPWFGFKLPRFTRWDGQVIKGRFPLISNFTKGQDSPHLQASTPIDVHSTFLSKFRDSMNGKGFVVSAGDGHAGQVFQLIGLLRALGNKLPIQIFHYGDLNQRNMDRISQIARKVDGLTLEGAIDNLSYILKHKGLKNLNDPVEVEKLFPPQEVWFVDARGTLGGDYKNYFESYGNKLIAYFFNSFKQAILIDTDTAPLVDLDYNVLQSMEFETKGAYFFQDREMHIYMDSGPEFIEYLKKLFPKPIDKEFLQTSQLTNFTLNNRFIAKHDLHLMESGVVAIDKNRHFLSMLTTMLINQFDQIRDIVYGEKEFFWLGFSVAGDEDYYLNKWPAGAVGSDITPLDKRIYFDGDNSTFFRNEVCSAHPGHLSGVDDRTLLWLNSGFVRCKNYESAVNDDMTLRLNPKEFDSLYELKKFYAGYQNFEYILIPGQTDTPPLNPYFENWWRMNECDGLIWCAYNNQTTPFTPNDLAFSMANHTFYEQGENADSNEPKIPVCPVRNSKEMKDGILVEFDQNQKAYYNYLGSVYDNALKIYGLQYI